MKYVRTLILAALAFIATPALAQWQVPLNAVPIGRGGGVQGFGAVVGSPGNSSFPLVSQGASPPIYTSLGFGGGGTGAVTQVGARNNMFPTAVRAGDIPYWNGTIWTTLSGNNSGSNCFGENASGVPSWVTCSGGGGTPGGSSGQVQYNNAGAFGGFTVGGDATLNTGTGALTLATVNANVGSFGSATQCTAFTTNGKGLITAASAVTCTPAVGSITGMGTGVAAALAVNTGTTGAFVVYGGSGGTPTALNLINATLLPLATGVTGTLQAAQEPAHTGDVTNTAGSLALSLVAGNAANLNSGTLNAARLGFAIKTDMQTPSSSTLVVNPRDVQDHPGTAKFWARLDGKSGATCAIAASYNIASCVRNSAGNYTLTFTTAFANVNYIVAGSAWNIGVNSGIVEVIAPGNYSTGNVIVGCFNTTSGAAMDCDIMNVIGLGTQ